MGNKAILIRASLIAAIWLTALSTGTLVYGQLATGWMVWIKTSPCSGRMDWVHVGQSNPTGQGGSSYYETADRVQGGLSCGRLGSRCTKAQADAEAAQVRSSPKFIDYCCQNTSIWRNTQTNRLNIVLGQFGTPGLGWQFEDGPMCCEQAERLTGITGACVGAVAGQKSNRQNDTAWTGKNLTFHGRQNADQCEADCNANPLCKGYTWIQAGTYSPGDPAMCYMMAEITGSNASRGHFSGMRSAGSTQKGGGGQASDMSGTWTADWAGSGCKWRFSLSKTGANTYSGYFDQCSSTGRKDTVSFIFRDNGTADMTLVMPNDGTRKFTVTHTSSTIIYSNVRFIR